MFVLQGQVCFEMPLRTPSFCGHREKEAFIQMAEGKNTANSCSGYGSDQWPNKTAGLVGPIDERFRIETKKKQKTNNVESEKELHLLR